MAESAATVEEASPRRFGHYEIATHSDGVTIPFAKGYDYSVSEGMLYSTVGMKDWPAVAQWCRNHLAANPEKIWPRTYLALALEMSGQQSRARRPDALANTRGSEVKPRTEADPERERGNSAT